MKNKITSALLCFFLSLAAFSQQKNKQVKRDCNAAEIIAEKMAKDPSIAKRMNEMESFTRSKIQEMSNNSSKISGDIIQIPVVIHVLYTNSSNNISTSQIQSQLDVLNADFRRTNSDRTNKWSQAADTKIEFYLAKVDPNGNATTGITRKQVSKSTWETDNSMKKSSSGGVNPWNTSEYLNMWIVDNLKSGSRTILGYAQFPWDTDTTTDGVVMADQYFGTSGSAQSPFDGGRTTTHEVGHYFGLRHIWGDGACGVDDFVSDTPESDAANYGCATGHNSCGSEDMVQNYMDYSDDSCMNLFTLGQKNRMHTYLVAGGARRALALSDKTGTPAVCNATVPTGVSTSGITSSGASVSWATVTNATYDVRHRQTGSSSWTTNAVSGASTSLSGLSASTQYEVQVRSKCSSGNSSYSASVNFTTPVVQINYCTSSGNTSYATGVTRVRFGSIDKADGTAKDKGYEDFTNLSTTVTQSSSVNLTVNVNTDGNYRVDAIAWVDWNQDGDFSDSGETIDLGNVSNVSNGALPTKAVTIPTNAKVGNTRMRVSAKYNANPTSCETNFDGEVEDYTVNVTAGVADTTAPIITLNGSSSMSLTVGGSFTDPGATASDNIDGNLTSSIVVTGSVNTSNVGAYTLNYNVSDAAGNAATQVSRTVNVNADTQVPSAPSNITATNIAQTTATLNWSASTDNVAVTGYEVFSGSTSVGTVTGTSANITGLTENTSYSYSVKAKDAAGNISSSSSLVTFTTLSTTVSYCASKGNRSTYEWIDYVSLGGMTNSTGDNGGYQDFTSKTATLAQGTTNQIIVSAGFKSSSYTEHWAVWIDFNRNGTFESSEKVVSGSSSSANNLSANISVPANAVLGQTRMRVSMKYNSAQTACESFNDGEVEDYTVNITSSSTRDAGINNNSETLGNEDSLNLSAYPNPSLNYIQVKLNSKSENLTYRIVNTLGQVVKHGKLNKNNISISDIKSGIYVLEVYDGQKSMTTKLVKM